MRLWRISNYASLDGNGGKISSGRWHTQGNKIVYLSESPGSALIERLVHLEIDRSDLPAFYQLLAVDIPDDVTFNSIDVKDLTGDWMHDDSITRAVGDRWLSERVTALLRVPSAVVAETANWLLNPEHPDAARAHIASVIRAPFDPRLFR